MDAPYRVSVTPTISPGAVAEMSTAGGTPRVTLAPPSFAGQVAHVIVNEHVIAFAAGLVDGRLHWFRAS